MISDMLRITDSNGQSHPLMRWLASDVEDVLGRVSFYIAVDQINVDLPQGDGRLMTTVHLFPNHGPKVPYIGSAIHNPEDEYSYRAGFIWAAYRAGLSYALNHPGPHFRYFRRVNSPAEIERKVRAWARRVWFEITSEVGDIDAMDRRFRVANLEALSERAEKFFNGVSDEPQEQLERDLSDLVAAFLGEPVNLNLDSIQDDDTERLAALKVKMDELEAEVDAAPDEIDEETARSFLGKFLKIIGEA